MNRITIANFRIKNIATKVLSKYDKKALVNIRNSIIQNDIDFEHLFNPSISVDRNSFENIFNSNRVISDCHSFNSKIYFLQILSSIYQLNFNNWNEHAIKLKYQECNDIFYCRGKLQLPLYFMSANLNCKDDVLRDLEYYRERKRVRASSNYALFLKKFNHKLY